MLVGHFDTTRRVLVVAEIGNNHEGRFDVAADLVRQAAACGAHAVKFQTFRTGRFQSRRDQTRYDRLASFELAPDRFCELRRLAASLGLLFLSTPLDLDSAGFLEALVDAYKIASGDNDFYPLIERVCATGKPVIVSAGLADLAQIQRTVAFIEGQWRARGIDQGLAVLHCVSSYPAPPEQANLAAIPYLAGRLRCTIGYSDHTVGITACLGAVALGARIIEKHFTLSKQFSSFRDHQLSADPEELRELVEGVAALEQMVGSAGKTVQVCEAEIAPLLRRSIVAAVDLPPGHRVAWTDLMWTRPAGGLAPGEEARVLGRTLKRPLAMGDPILPCDLE